MKRISWTIWAIIAWLVFVVSLTIWWLIFSLRIIAQLSSYVSNSQVEHHQKMLVMEGATLIIFLIVGGSALVYFALRERSRFEEVRHFFSAFSHDLKTSISRLVLQGELIFKNDKASAESRQFQKNLLALEMQLENSLHLAHQETRSLTLQEVNIKSIVSRIHGHWPDLKVHLQDKGTLVSDAVALESIVKNLVSNSVLHGQADEVNLKVSTNSENIEILYFDNGKPFTGSLEVLGAKPQPSQMGTGIGLYIVHRWAKRLRGQIRFSLNESGSLQVHLTLPLFIERTAR